MQTTETIDCVDVPMPPGAKQTVDTPATQTVTEVGEIREVVKSIPQKRMKSEDMEAWMSCSRKMHEAW